LKGIENQYELPDETLDDVWSLSDNERKAMGIQGLPQSLNQAIGQLEDSELAAEILGESVFDFVLRNKRREWADYRAQVTPFELRQNLLDL
jgi:glutamine synthetase